MRTVRLWLARLLAPRGYHVQRNSRRKTSA
jgi:hypothetical protein